MSSPWGAPWVNSDGVEDGSAEGGVGAAQAVPHGGDEAVELKRLAARALGFGDAAGVEHQGVAGRHVDAARLAGDPPMAPNRRPVLRSCASPGQADGSSTGGLWPALAQTSVPEAVSKMPRKAVTNWPAPVNLGGPACSATPKARIPIPGLYGVVTMAC
ncbi:MAG TPA: hypothetical protein PLG21_01230 [Anaerolineae bacterium]|nr:hypothetical protein [Anaerolineae bacterium]